MSQNRILPHEPRVFDPKPPRAYPLRTALHQSGPANVRPGSSSTTVTVAALLRIIFLPPTREADCERNTTKPIMSASEISKASTQTITSSFRPNIAVGCANEGQHFETAH